MNIRIYSDSFFIDVCLSVSPHVLLSICPSTIMVGGDIKTQSMIKPNLVHYQGFFCTLGFNIPLTALIY